MQSTHVGAGCDGTGGDGQPLTFSLDLEHADGILGAEAAELAGGQRVASLAPGRVLGAPQASGLEERRRAEHRHPAPLPARGGVYLGQPPSAPAPAVSRQPLSQPISSRALSRRKYLLIACGIRLLATLMCVCIGVRRKYPPTVPPLLVCHPWSWHKMWPLRTSSLGDRDGDRGSGLGDGGLVCAAGGSLCCWGFIPLPGSLSG